MEWTKKQQEFIDAVMNGESVFLKGKAGTGKSTVTKHVMKVLSEQSKPFVAAAPTGIAAANLGGVTIHSLFALPVHGVIDHHACRYISRDKRRILDKAKTIIIDEVSMVRADMMDGIEYTLNKNRCGSLKHRQLILIGDMKQLQPVADENFTAVMQSDEFGYPGVGFEWSKFLRDNKEKIRVIDLDEVKRQDDEEFITALNIVREGGKSDYFKQFLGRGEKGVVLAPHKDTVHRYNVEGLAKLEGKEYVFKSEVEGNARADDFNLDNVIYVKNGAKIMYLVNSPRGSLVNGTIGEFVTKMVTVHRREFEDPDFDSEDDKVKEVRYKDVTEEEEQYFIRVRGIDFRMEKVTLSKQEYVIGKEDGKLELQTIGSITQYPFRLAYALTIHKSQGLTFDEVTLDLSAPCFSDGQLYVGLSRVRTPQGLSIITGDRKLKS